MMAAGSTAFPLLTAMLMLPLLAGALICFFPGGAPRKIALAAVLLDLILALWVFGRFDPANVDFQLVERAVWVPTLNLNYMIGVDGVSVLFLPLTMLLFLGVLGRHQ